MAHVVIIEPNGSQDLVSLDDVMNDIVAHSWYVFIRWFKGFNLIVAQDFTHTFYRTRAKIGDLQLEVTEDSIA